MKMNRSTSLVWSSVLKASLGLGASFWAAALCAVAAEPASAEPPGHAPAQQKVIVVEYSGFDCAPCAEVSGLLNKLGAARKLSLQVLFKNAPRSPEALLAHEAALAAGQQGKFWEMHDLLFAQPTTNYAQILEMARTLNLDFKRFQTAIDEREFREKVMTDLIEARGLGIEVTPTIFLNGTKLQGIEQIQSFVTRATSPPSEPPNPDTIHKFDLAGSPSSGPDDAPVTIVEFADFRCGYCAEHSRIVTELVSAYPGKIRRIFKHFPIQPNADGKLPHLGSMAAMVQGRFWDMHRALMNRPLSGRDDLISRAVAIGLDMPSFVHDLDASEGANIIQRDIEEGDRSDIRMTPTTFINGRLLSGRADLESLKKRVDSILAPMSAQNVDKANPSEKQMLQF
jgi:protein-disulfide isomerase